jgi:3-hydroxyacyl-CoA dehydrogenase
MAVRIETEGDTAIVVMDHPPVNAINRETRKGLLDAFGNLATDASIDRIILTGVGTAFAAGADAREFDLLPLEPHLPEAIDAIETCGKPVIAAIDGPALGGGYELALACSYRLATPNAVIGLPEVNLGVVPGAGGTQRLPRLIGIAKAVSLISEGRTVNAREALEVGMVDDIVDDPVGFAKRLDLRMLGSIEPLSSRPKPEEDHAAIEKARASAAKRKSGQTAPSTAVDLVAEAAEKSFSEAIEAERKAFLKLRQSDQAKALRHLFFAERAARVPDDLKKVEPVKVTTAVVVGGGTMGASIAYSLNAVGIGVTVVEMNEEAQSKAQANVSILVDDAVKRGLLDAPIADERKAGIGFNVGYDDLPRAELAIEAAFEDMAVKKDIFAKLSAGLPETAILASNTSYLDVNEIAAAVPAPERVLGLHFFSPAHIMKLLEVVRADRTGPVALATGFELARRLRKVPVLAGVCDGFIGNRILARYREIADITMIDGSTPFEIDAAMVEFGYPMGPYMAQDLAGLDIAYANRKRLAPTRDPNRRYVTVADRLVEAGRLGRKTGRGWYQYEGGTAAVDPAIEAIVLEEAERAGIGRKSYDHSEIVERLVTAMINEGFDILQEGIAATPADIDLVLVHGYGYPRWRGGLMHTADAIGLDDVLARVRRYAVEDPVLWSPSPLLEQVAKDGISLHDLNGAKK